MERKSNPIIYSDFPDPDIIRVEDTYYMVSTTMHFMPGCNILRSYDLLNWEFVAYAYDELETNLNHKMEDGNIYGQGMWAPSFRFHKGMFYICFSANDTKQTYLLTANHIKGPWKQQTIKGFYHDSSLFFDDDDRIYLVHGNHTLYLTELDDELKGPKAEGVHKVIATDKEGIPLGYEGCHLYKHEGKYYLFAIHWPNEGTKRRRAICFVADALEGVFKGRPIIDDDLGFFNQGVAQGGMVDTPEGEWYLFMFQDRGAIGRVPIIMPMTFKDGYPAIGGNGKVPNIVSTSSTRPGYSYDPLNGDDDFYYNQGEGANLKSFWQFNHLSNPMLWSVTERFGAFRLTSGNICSNLTQSFNTLTQRMMGPTSSAWVTVDGTLLNDGDYAGISAFSGGYGAIALTKESGQYYLVMLARPSDYKVVMGRVNDEAAGIEYAKVEVESPIVTLKVRGDFKDLKDEASFFYRAGDTWQQLGPSHKLYFKLDHFTGCRFGLFMFSTQVQGGKADFLKFCYHHETNN